MSDPFEAFESANGANGNGNGANEDPAAAFLAREELEFAKVVNNDFSNDAFGSFGKFAKLFGELSFKPGMNVPNAVLLGEGTASETSNQAGSNDPFAEPSQETGGENKVSGLQFVFFTLLEPLSPAKERQETRNVQTRTHLCRKSQIFRTR